MKDFKILWVDDQNNQNDAIIKSICLKNGDPDFIKVLNDPEEALEFVKRTAR